MNGERNNIAYVPGNGRGEERCREVSKMSERWKWALKGVGVASTTCIISKCLPSKLCMPIFCRDGEVAVAFVEVEVVLHLILSSWLIFEYMHLHRQGFCDTAVSCVNENCLKTENTSKSFIRPIFRQSNFLWSREKMRSVWGKNEHMT